MFYRKLIAVVSAGWIALPVSASEVANTFFNRHLQKQAEADRARGVPTAQRLAVSELVPKGGDSASSAARNKTQAQKKTADGRWQKKQQRKRNASLSEAHTGQRRMSPRSHGSR